MSEAVTTMSLAFPEELDCINLSSDKSATSSDPIATKQCAQTGFSAAIPIDVTVCSVEEPEFVHRSAASNSMEPENNTASLIPAEIGTLTGVIQEMRSSNDNLLRRVIQLEQTLANCQNDLQVYKQRSLAAESMLSQTAQDFAAASHEVEFLSHKVNTADRTVQHQEVLIENLTAQLASSQERMAQMERECSHTQANYNEKFHQLLQSENSCRDLRTRLIRQQRYTMQLKFALEKCLEIPNHSYQFQGDEDNMWTTTNGQTVDSEQAQFLFPKAQPITPWSAQTVCLGELDSTWAESSEFGSQRVKENFPEESGWQDLFNLSWFDSEEEDTANAEEDFLMDNAYTLNQPNPTQDLSNQTAYSPPSESPQPNPENRKTDPNWPSPLVYPCHPPKGRKSLSAIELPTFTKK